VPELDVRCRSLRYNFMDDGHIAMELHKKGQDAADKFDYYMCGIASALFAYTAEHYVPRRFGCDFYLLDPVSIVLLLATFCFGIHRIKIGRKAINYNFLIVDADRKVKELDEMLQTPGAHRDLDGQICSRQKLEQDMAAYRSQAKAAELGFHSCRASANNTQNLRDWLLLSGFAAILFSKLLLPYVADSSSSATAASQPLHIVSPAPHPTALPFVSPPAAPASTNKTSN
jgi:hypothetical protein